MQITQKQLITHLKQILSPLYLLSGDEPLLLQETRDEIIKAAKSHEFSEKETFYIDSGFQIEKLIESVCNGSLFSTDKLSAAQQKAEWYELIKQHGVIIPIWPIRSNELPAWIIERAKEFQLTFSIDVAQMLAHFSEGNILSAQQALEKLSVLYPNAAITREQLITVLFDHARFGIFDLSESIMTNNPKKIMRILTRLEQTGEEPTLVLWAICRKLRENSASDKAKKALQKAARVDEIKKGARIGNVWQALTELCL